MAETPHSLAVGVIVTCAAATPGAEQRAAPVCEASAVLIGQPGHAPWTRLRAADGVVQYYAGGLTLSLHKRDCDGYRRNLDQAVPRLYVISRPEPDGRLRPAAATVDPFEAEVYDLDGDDQVDAVAMPAPIRAWLSDFVAANQVEQPFIKRRRAPHRDQAPQHKGRILGPRYG